MPNTSHRYYVLGWLASVRYDPLAGLYEAWVPQWPRLLATPSARYLALPGPN